LRLRRRRRRRTTRPILGFIVVGQEYSSARKRKQVYHSRKEKERAEREKRDRHCSISFYMVEEGIGFIREREMELTTAYIPTFFGSKG